MVLLPERLCRGLPALGVCPALFAQVLRAFRCFQVGRMRAGFCHHFGQKLRVFEHRTWAQVVFVERLPLAIELEQRLLQALQKTLISDVGARVVDKDARLDIACGVDVAVDSAARNAAAGKLAVVLEVDAIQPCDLFVAEKAAHSAVSISSVN